MDKKSNARRYLTLFVLALAGSLIYKLPYLRETYYIPLQDATGTTNAQLGFLMSAYGLANFILYFPGGWAADRFSPKKLIAFSCVSTGLVGLYYSTLPSYSMLVVIHAVFAITTVFTFWPVAIRIIRLLGESKEQGRLYGAWYFGKGLVSTILGFASVPLFAKIGEGISGLKGIIVYYSILIAIVGVIAYFTIDDTKTAEDKKEKIKAKDLLVVLKMPSMWIAGLLVFATWSIYIGFGMVTPYLTDVFKMGATLAVVVSTVRAYVLFSAGGLFGGVISDKIGSRIKFMLFCFIGMILFTSVYVLMPGDPNYAVIVVVNMILLGLCVYCANAVFFSVIDEVDVPKKLSGTAAGLMSVIGYFPEIFLYTLVGQMVDNNPGVQGYRNVFVFMLGCGFVGLACSIVLLAMKKKATARKKEAILAAGFPVPVPVYTVEE